ncbi:copper chaperone PCu(A)C [Microvirga splendida]|uniref:Copper chaperone PCu(A)C n=1 Tax=Microvirga splendida TaxID=2795727 RepID=A0ABS0Y7Z5_9HYPH|nr:copper chaperone PCu(A)C [Microvirga splendida]MBJ6128422.1 copper chaperone PCu(A)C [Microvirga splendida]
MSLLATSAVMAHEFKAGEVVVHHPVVRANPNGAKVGAGYLTIRNVGSTPDRLVSIESPAAASVQAHQNIREGGAIRMSEHKDGVLIPAGGEVSLMSGGDHMMFTDLKAPFKVGEPVTGTLIFERAGRVPVNFIVEPIGGSPAAEHAGHKVGS